MQVPVQNIKGEVVSQTEISDLVFGIEPNLAVMHQALVRQQANGRAGTHNTRTRSDVRGGGRKPYRQKGTGHARQGSLRAPQFRGGGVVFGPHPRSYEQKMPRKMRRLALRSVLSQKISEDALSLVSGLNELEPRTAAMAQAISDLKVDGRSVLIATNGECQPVVKAGGNLPKVKVIQASNLNVADLLKYDHVLLDSEAVEALQKTLLDGVNAERQAARFSTKESEA